MILLPMLLSGSILNLAALNNTSDTTKLEIGIDFVRFNRNWIYYSDLLQPTDGNLYAFDLIPSIFFKYPVKKLSFRFKYEFFKNPYSFETSSIDVYQQIDGNLLEHRISTGVEKYLKDKNLKFYYLIDCGVSFTTFNGIYSYNNIDYTMLSDPFNIHGVTFFLQPGLGLKYKISKRLYISLESAVWFGKGFEKDDNHNINPDNRFIPRPISLFGLSYQIH
jgi:hypothetical protein